MCPFCPPREARVKEERKEVEIAIAKPERKPAITSDRFLIPFEQIQRELESVRYMNVLQIRDVTEIEGIGGIYKVRIVGVQAIDPNPLSITKPSIRIWFTGEILEGPTDIGKRRQFLTLAPYRGGYSEDLGQAFYVCWSNDKRGIASFDRGPVNATSVVVCD